MKKLRLLALVLCAGVALSGCTSMLERSYSSHTAHVDYSVTEDSSILRAESYQALLNSILYYVNEHTAGGTIRLYNYSGDVEADLQQACRQVTEEDPLGAYAVNTIHYESTRILTYYEVNFRITYRRTADQLAGIQTVSGQSGIRQELERMTASLLSQTTLRTAYFTGDADAVSDLFWLAFYDNPAIVVEIPQLAVTFYPQEGTQRILEVDAAWPVSAAEMAEYALELADAAARFMEENSPANEHYTVEELAALLRNTVIYDPSGSHTALAALRGDPVNDLGMLLALEYLCQQADVEVSVAADTAGAQMWLIVSTPSGYRHLLPKDLRPTESDTAPGADPEESGEDTPWHLPLYTDEELSALGFVWPEGLHPPCVDYSGILPE